MFKSLDLLEFGSLNGVSKDDLLSGHFSAYHVNRNECLRNRFRSELCVDDLSYDNYVRRGNFPVLMIKFMDGYYEDIPLCHACRSDYVDSDGEYDGCVCRGFDGNDFQCFNDLSVLDVYCELRDYFSSSGVITRICEYLFTPTVIISQTRRNDYSIITNAKYSFIGDYISMLVNNEQRVVTDVFNDHGMVYLLPEVDYPIVIRDLGLVYGDDDLSGAAFRSSRLCRCVTFTDEPLSYVRRFISGRALDMNLGANLDGKGIEYALAFSMQPGFYGKRSFHNMCCLLIEAGYRGVDMSEFLTDKRFWRYKRYYSVGCNMTVRYKKRINFRDDNDMSPETHPTMRDIYKVLRHYFGAISFYEIYNNLVPYDEGGYFCEYADPFKYKDLGLYYLFDLLVKQKRFTGKDYQLNHLINLPTDFRDYSRINNFSVDYQHVAALPPGLYTFGYKGKSCTVYVPISSFWYDLFYYGYTTCFSPYADGVMLTSRSLLRMYNQIQDRSFSNLQHQLQLSKPFKLNFYQMESLFLHSVGCSCDTRIISKESSDIDMDDYDRCHCTDRGCPRHDGVDNYNSIWDYNRDTMTSKININSFVRRIY